jgi:cell division protein FtsW (lipid II flippase)
MGRRGNPLLQNKLLTQRILFILAAVFLGIFALSLTLAPAARSRSWNAELIWSHWLGYLVWLVGFTAVHIASKKNLKQIDPILLPLVSILSGWGLLTIWRLTPKFGFRQTGWLALCLLVVTLGIQATSALSFLRRYKYIWLTGGLILTSLTLVLGTNPLGFGPRLWLGWGGIYLQPSEPLKLLLVVYLASYFADWSTVLIDHQNQRTISLFPRFRNGYAKVQVFGKPTYPQIQILIPTLIMTGLSILILLVQRDLGTASIFVLLYSVIVFLVTRWLWVPVISTVFLVGAGMVGYQIFDVIRLRVDSWINPWIDPSGRSYQIVQSILAVANGGVFGRGPGLGYPSLVPITHSDFIFSAIGEESGLFGVIGLLAVIGLLTWRGFRISIQANDKFLAYLSAGLTTFLAAQSLLIIGGNLRLMPLTGVTLPFVSYGGSSLLTSFLVVTILLHIKNKSGDSDYLMKLTGIQNRTGNFHQALTYATTILFVGVLVTALVSSWWGVIRSADLLTRTDNPRRWIADLTIPRGDIYDRRSEPIVKTTGQSGSLERVVEFSSLTPIVGYTHPVYGQSGLESSLDPILRGVEGQDPFMIWWSRLLYGHPPSGLDVRLTLDLNLQTKSDELLQDHNGAVILLNAENGEILVMGSYPYYGSDQLETQWEDLVQDPLSPLVNRATQATYPIGDLSTFPFIQSVIDTDTGEIALRLPLAVTDDDQASSPLEISLAAASLSSMGIRPAPILVQFVENPINRWSILAALSETAEVMSSVEAAGFIHNLKSDNGILWLISLIPEGEDVTWFLGGTTTEWTGAPLAMTLVLEEQNEILAKNIGETLLWSAMNP